MLTNAHTPSVLLATVPLKEQDVDFLDSSSAGVSKGPETASCPAGDETCVREQKFLLFLFLKSIHFISNNVNYKQRSQTGMDC